MSALIKNSTYGTFSPVILTMGSQFSGSPARKNEYTHPRSRSSPLSIIFTSFSLYGPPSLSCPTIMVISLMLRLLPTAPDASAVAAPLWLSRWDFSLLVRVWQIAIASRSIVGSTMLCSSCSRAIELSCDTNPVKKFSMADSSPLYVRPMPDSKVVVELTLGILRN